LNEGKRLKIDIGNLDIGYRRVTLKTENKFDYNSENIKIANLIE